MLIRRVYSLIVSDVRPLELSICFASIEYSIERSTRLGRTRVYDAYSTSAFSHRVRYKASRIKYLFCFNRVVDRKKYSNWTQSST